MTPQVMGLIGFAAVILLLSVMMWPSPRKLNGRQKYRRHRRPGTDLDPNTNKQSAAASLQVILATLLGQSAASTGDHAEGSSDSGESGDSGGGDGGGD